MTVQEFPVDSSAERPEDDALELLDDGEETVTVVPTDVSEVDCLTHWMTVDRELLCDLSEMR